MKIAVAGCCGRMGSTIVKLLVEEKNATLAGALEAEDHPCVGKDIGEIIGIGPQKIRISSDPEEVIKASDCLIDFTIPSVSCAHVAIARSFKKKMVIGTTGLSVQDGELLKKASLDIPLVVSSNMSIGVNLLFHLVHSAAETLGKEFQVEIVEMHHQFKKDAPSGTALSLAKEVASARAWNLPEVAVYGREGKTLARKEDEMGIHAVRAGSIVGEHTVFFCSPQERIELTHRASSREVFAAGALRAARFLQDKTKGLYGMDAVLGLKR